MLKEGQNITKAARSVTMDGWRGFFGGVADRPETRQGGACAPTSSPGQRYGSARHGPGLSPRSQVVFALPAPPFDMQFCVRAAAWER